MTIIRKLLRDGTGVGTIEYALVAMLISVAAIAGYTELGAKVQTHFSTIDQNVSNHL
jgi:Flp pilus assembly pilin Flp